MKLHGARSAKLGGGGGCWRHRVLEAAVAKILEDTGGINILVNNAGVTRDGLLMRMSEADWDAVLIPI